MENGGKESRDNMLEDKGQAEMNGRSIDSNDSIFRNGDGGAHPSDQRASDIIPTGQSGTHQDQDVRESTV